jgi:hypothetical protein
MSPSLLTLLSTYIVLIALPFIHGDDIKSYDVVVYDASSGGVTAAVSSSRKGHRTAILCASYPSCFKVGGKRVGGMSSGGLGQTDIGPTYPFIGGIALEFYQRNRKHYNRLFIANTTVINSGSSQCRLPSRKCNVTFNVEPHVARSIYENMLNESGVDIFYAASAIKVSKTRNQTINTITTINNLTFSAKLFIDASYEGDLMALANVSYAIGRESQSEYNESLAGHRMQAKSHQFEMKVNPFDDNGLPLPFTTLPNLELKQGDADNLVQSYNFRLCVTTNKTNTAPFVKPTNYDASKYLLLQRYLMACSSSDRISNNNMEGGVCQLGFPSCNTAELPNGKFDMNNCGPFSSDFIGGSKHYPDASFNQRKRIWQNHLQYQQGLLYYLRYDPNVPLHYQNQMKSWGLCKDEFQDNLLAKHWPPSLYVRAARRLVGDHIFTQNSPQEQKNIGGIGNLSIAIGGYNFDSHNAERLACHNSSVCCGQSPKNVSINYAWNEGDVETSPGIYQIPLWIMFPKISEATNLLVVATPSASHIGMSTLRMEPQFMMIGHAAGTVASIAIQSNIDAVQNINEDTMKSMLEEEGMILEV